MNRKPFFIIPMALIIHSATLSLYTFYSGPSPFNFQDINAIWPPFFTLLGAIYFAQKLKARYWGISIIALALAGFPRALIATVPAHTDLLVVATLALDAISSFALLAAFKHDTFDLNLWEGKQTSGSFLFFKTIIVLAIMAGIFFYYGKT